MPKDAPKWLDYQADALKKGLSPDQPLLYPIMVGMPQAKIFRDRIKTPALAIKGVTGVPRIMPRVMHAVTERQGKLFEPVFNHYYDFYHKYDEQQGGAIKPSPLDLYGIEHPVVFLFWLQHKNWAFSGNKQFDVENDDRSNPTVQKMTTFGNRRGLLVYNGCEADYRLKYNLYVTVSQTETVGGKDVYMSTDIIIDPGMNTNTGSAGGGGEGLP